MQYRADIDGLRALAVVAVVLGHAHVTGFAGGFVGVDVFFVISGFLITSILVKEARGGTFSLLRFYERRARRIFPALFCMLGFAAVAAWWRLPADEFAAFGRGVVATTFFVSNFLFWCETGYFDLAAEERPLLHTWSLAVEEQFYLLFPLAVWWTTRHLAGRFALWLWPVMAASFALAVWGVEAHPKAAFYLAPTRAWELLAGSALALRLVPLPRTHSLREMVAALGVLCIATSVVFYSKDTPFPGVNAVLPCLGAALVIHAGLAGPTLASRLLSLKPIVFVGLISYSLYLWHWPLLVFARHWSPDPLSPGMTLGVIAVSFVAAVLSWRFVEQPFRRSHSVREGFAWSQRSIFSGSALASSACVVFGLGIVASSGVPSRFPDVAVMIEGSRGEGVLELDACDAARQSFDEIIEHCSFGKEGGENIVVWGDSHALSWLPVFTRFAESTGAGGVLMTTPGCASLVGAFRRDDRHADFHCEPETTEALFEVTKRLEPAAVFLVSRWAIYNHFWKLSDEAQTSKSAKDSREVFERGIERTVAAFREAGIPVVLVKSVPLLNDKPAQLFVREQQGKRARTSLDEHATWQRFANARIDEQAADGFVHVLDPADFLCNTDCRYHDETGFFYRDDNHLSAYGGAAMYAGLRGELDEIWSQVTR